MVFRSRALTALTRDLSRRAVDHGDFSAFLIRRSDHGAFRHFRKPPISKRASC
jgi:hypothetical protein